MSTPLRIRLVWPFSQNLVRITRFFNQIIVREGMGNIAFDRIKVAEKLNRHKWANLSTYFHIINV